MRIPHEKSNHQINQSKLISKCNWKINPVGGGGGFGSLKVLEDCFLQTFIVLGVPSRHHTLTINFTTSLTVFLKR